MIVNLLSGDDVTSEAAVVTNELLAAWNSNPEAQSYDHVLKNVVIKFV